MASEILRPRAIIAAAISLRVIYLFGFQPLLLFNLQPLAASAAKVESPSAVSSNIGTAILPPVTETKSEIFVNEQGFVPLDGFTPVFKNSLLVFRGDISFFHLQKINVIELNRVRGYPGKNYHPVRSELLFGSLNCDQILLRYRDMASGTMLPDTFDHKITSVRKWLLLKLCVNDLCVRNVQVNVNKTKSSGQPCFMDRKSLSRMQYRLDIIDYSELYMYVGRWYQNLTCRGREVGLELIKTLGNRTLCRDSTYEEGLVKLNQTFRNDREGLGNIFYWMLRRTEAAFVTTRAEFPWHWNQFKKLMKKDKSLRFSHTGTKKLNDMKTNRGLDGSGFEPSIHINGPWYKYMPELQWMMRRIHVLKHSGVLGYLSKWDLVLRPPIKEKLNEFIEERDCIPGFKHAA